MHKQNILITFSIIILSLIFIDSRYTLAQDKLKYCNAVQNNVGLIRYPFGTIGISSSDVSEINTSMTLVPRVYPCLNSVKVRGEKENWNADVSGDPSNLVIKYNANKPSGSTIINVTDTPHVAILKVTFPKNAQDKFLVFDFSRYRVDDWSALYKWNERKITRIDNKTIEATVGEPNKNGAYYTIKFSEPCISSGIIDSSGNIINGAADVKGSRLGMYAKFNSSTITIAISESFESLNQTKEFLDYEFIDFDSAYKNCRKAWNDVLSHVQIEGSESNKRIAYTALYSILVNIIDGSKGSYYLKYYNKPKNLASSEYWQFIGGFQRCAWDNHRTAYPFLMLSYPDVMSDIVNTYLASYHKDGFFAGNACLFTGPTGGHKSIKFTSVLVAEALASNIMADFNQLYTALKDNYSDSNYVPNSLVKYGYVTQPPTGGKACSETLEWATNFYSLAQLAKANNELEKMHYYLNLSKSYKNVWDSTIQAFRVKNPDGSWGPTEYKSWTWNPNPQGLFEGTTEDWMFAVPHDPYGLINLPGQKDFVKRVTKYCMNDTWFNDYQYNYPYLLYYDDAANIAQKIIRKIWLPLFKDGVMYEGASPKPGYKPWKTHYTSNAGWVLSSMLGLYPVLSPLGQYIITSPSVKKAVIRNGDRSITIEAKNNSQNNIYISSIKVDGKDYPCYMIPSNKLLKGVKIELRMSSDSTKGLGNLYVSSTDGYVQNVELISSTHLKCTIEAAVEKATTKIYSATRPVKVTINGKETKMWTYDEKKKTITIENNDIAEIEVLL